MRSIALLLCLSVVLAACGADGTPEAPATRKAQGIAVTGDASVGVVVQN